jgi:hypothetical protein
MGDWRVIDGRDPADGPENFPFVRISSETELRQELARQRQLEPGIVSLSSPVSGALQIGIGGPLAGIRWYVNPYPPGQSRDVLADHAYAEKRIDFLAEGDHIAFWPENLMPVDQAIEIVVYFFNHQRLPDWVGWKEWDPAACKWKIKPAASVRSA